MKTKLEFGDPKSIEQRDDAIREEVLLKISKQGHDKKYWMSCPSCGEVEVYARLEHVDLVAEDILWHSDSSCHGCVITRFNGEEK